MTTIISQTVSSNENYNGDGDFALVTITPEDAKRYLKLIALANKLSEDDLGTKLYKLVLWNYDADYVHGGVDFELEEGILGGDDGTISDDDPRVAEYKENAVRTECNTISICNDRVYWQCILKYSSVRLESGSVYKNLLEEIAAGEDNDDDYPCSCEVT